MEKIKKIFPALLIFLFISWFSYKFFIAKPKNNKGPTAIDWEELDASSSSKPEEVPVTLKRQKDINPIKKTTEKSFNNNEDDEFLEFDRIEKKWLLIAKDIIGEKDYPAYLEMRENNDKEKMIAYKEYHDYLRQKYGDKFTYNISEDQSIREKKINQKYLKDLMGKIGREKFQLFILARDKINEENRRKNELFMQIEF